jgi:hypothetical protein
MKAIGGDILGFFGLFKSLDVGDGKSSQELHKALCSLGYAAMRFDWPCKSVVQQDIV